MNRFEELAMYLRLARRLPSYLRERDSLEQGRALIAARLARREENFLVLVEQAIFSHPGSPYLPLLREAGCELGDLRRMVGDEGLEPTLRRLREAGVYVSFEESKGRTPIRRSRLEYAIAPGDFDNPRGRAHLTSATSGSTGQRTRNPIDLDYLAAQSPIRMVIQEAQGIRTLPRATVRGPLPESSSFGGGLDAPRQGGRPERWFTPELDPPRVPELRFRIAHRFVSTVARLCGARIPRPEPLRMNQVDVVARWAADAVQREGGALVDCTPSLALRIAVAAARGGIDLTGVVFRTGGEPMTEAKMAAIRAAGARAVVDYPMSGLAGLGFGCLRPIGVNDQHLRTDHLAFAQAPREVAAREVDALLLTTLLPSAPRVWLNLESDDYGVLAERSCGCPLEELGFSLHVRDVRSFKKGADGLTRVWIHVSPSVDLDDERQVVEAVLAGLESASISADLAVRLWNQAGAIGVRRVAPIVGGRGKLLPLHLAKRSEANRETK